MKFSKDLKWFTHIRWDEQDCFIDCLVNVAELEKDEFLLIEIDGELKIYSYDQIQKRQLEGRCKIIGTPKKMDCPLR